MPTKVDSIFRLAQAYEETAGEIIDLALAQQRAGLLSQSEFNQVYQDYMSIMQRARDMYYGASHQLAQSIATEADVAALSTATDDLKKTLTGLQTTEKAISIALKVLTVVGTVAAAVLDPTHVSVAAAAASIATAAQGIAAAAAAQPASPSGS